MASTVYLLPQVLSTGVDYQGRYTVYSDYHILPVRLL